MVLYRDKMTSVVITGNGRLPRIIHVLPLVKQNEGYDPDLRDESQVWSIQLSTAEKPVKKKEMVGFLSYLYYAAVP